MSDRPTVGLLCLHTCPLEQPGSGDAGGMNVYVRNLASALAQQGWRAHITTIGTLGRVEPSPGVVVDHVDVGVPRTRKDLAENLPRVTSALLAAGPPPAQVLHSHYWISGRVGVDLAAAWDLPLVHTMHTTALVKESYSSPGQHPEPTMRADAERQITARAEGLIANTRNEAEDLERLYGADPARITAIAPGVDLGTFIPGRTRPAGPPFEIVMAGRQQRLKGPHVLIDAVEILHRRRPDLALKVSIIGAASGDDDLDLPSHITRAELDGIVTREAPLPPSELAQRFRDADVVAMPSAYESFGLVALEAQASGTPVLATRVGGLTDAVDDGRTGLLLDSLDPAAWADAFERLADDVVLRERLGAAGPAHAGQFTWARTAEQTAAVYRSLLR